jgi:hypothetical protein
VPAIPGTNHFPSELVPGRALDVRETEFYRGIDTQALIVEQGLVRDARFLMASGFQAPRTIRAQSTRPSMASTTSSVPTASFSRSPSSVT